MKWRHGIISPFAGTGIAGYRIDGGPAKEALLNGPAGLAVDTAGNVYFVDFHRHVIRIIRFPD